MLNGMDNSLQAVNLGNAQRATRNKQRETTCRPIALSDCRSFLSDASPSRLAHRPSVSNDATDLLADRPALGDDSTRLSHNSPSLCRRSADLLNDGTELLDNSTAMLNHSPRLPNRCKPLKTSILAENGQKLLFFNQPRTTRNTRKPIRWGGATDEPARADARPTSFRVFRVFRGQFSILTPNC